VLLKSAFSVPGSCHVRLHTPRLARHAAEDGRAAAEGREPVKVPAKRLVNRRLEQTGAKWAVAHVGPLVELTAFVDTPDWTALWTAA
jgi:hypothetical protein